MPSLGLEYDQMQYGSPCSAHCTLASTTTREPNNLHDIHTRRLLLTILQVEPIEPGHQHALERVALSARQPVEEMPI